MKTSWRSASLVATAAAMLALTGCGQDGGTQSVGSQQVGAAAAANGYGNATASPSTGAGNGYGADSQDQSSSTSSASAGQLAVAENAKLGEVVTDSKGMTLYRFDNDTSEPPKSSCDGDCAKTWPPVAAEGATAASGIDKSLLGEVTRADGTKQLTVAGWPQYYYAKDTKAGDVNGQGVGNKWYASAPDGKKAGAVDLLGLSTRNDPELGEIVVDKNGRTVYRFLKDEAWPKPVSACTGACLEKWPAVAPVDINDTKGIQKKGFMNFSRPDGVKQQTINCWPVYTFSGDKAPGDTNGQGVGGTWYVVSPNGKPIGAPAK